MNAELIRLSRKAVKEWADTDGYNQASQLINLLCDELEASAPAEPLEPKAQAYRTIAQHVFSAHRKYEGGKVLAILADDIRDAVAFRRTNPQILNPGGLWSESFNIYGLLGATPKMSPKPMWTFPSGATITFSHLEMEQTKYDWQGAQVPLIMFDELTHFSESVFFYMLSRNRSMCGVKPYVRATCNPDADSWVAPFIAWWIDQDTGYPIPERCGKIRWMYRSNDTIYWADKKTELWERFNLNTKEERAEPKSVAFINSTLQDNKLLMQRDPSYLANLKALPTVERERLLYGNWKISFIYEN